MKIRSLLFHAIAPAAATIAVMRIAGVKTEAFQAVAHLLVGGLFGAWLMYPGPSARWILWDAAHDPITSKVEMGPDLGRHCLAVALSLTAVEIVVFLLQTFTNIYH